MPYLKEYMCSVHGPFESKAKRPQCPYGCNTIFWSPRTPPAIRTNSVMKNMDGLMVRVAQEQGLSDMRSKYEGESVADHRPQVKAPADYRTPQEYMQAVATGQAPAAATWGAPSQVGLRAPSQEERAVPTQTVDAWQGRPPPKVPTIPYNRPDPNERATVIELAKSGNV